MSSFEVWPDVLSSRSHLAIKVLTLRTSMLNEVASKVNQYHWHLQEHNSKCARCNVRLM
jgi:hypothetical protein